MGHRAARKAVEQYDRRIGAHTMKLPALAKNLAAADGLQAKLQLLELVRGAGVPLDRAEAAR